MSIYEQKYIFNKNDRDSNNETFWPSRFIHINVFDIFSQLAAVLNQIPLVRASSCRFDDKLKELGK